MGKNNNNTSWKDFDYGKTFSAKDIKKAEKSGFSQNQILKIAASAPFVKNSANKALSSSNSTYTNPTSFGGQDRSTRTGNTAGSANLLSSYINSKLNDKNGNKDPKKVFTWNGVNADGRANALTINKPSGDLFGTYSPNQKSGEPYGQWSTPLKIQNRNAPTTGLVTSSPSFPSGEGGGGGTPSFDGGDGGPMGSMDPLKKESTSIAGFDSSINDSVTSFRRKKSRARALGLTSKGTSQFKIGGQSSRSSGVNLGIG